MDRLSAKSTLGIIAGGGDLPKRLIETCRQQERPFFLVALDHQADPSLIIEAHMVARLGEPGRMINRLRAESVTELVMAGCVRRPSLKELKPDWRAVKFFAHVGLRALGDDGLLSAIAKELENEGFIVKSVQDILPQVLAKEGQWGQHVGSELDWIDIRRGKEVVEALGRLDVGQAVVVQQGLVLGVEAIEGTDALIRRCVELKREGGGGVLVKMSKPQQDNRVDLPTLGPATVKACADAGFAGIAVSAGSTLVIDEPTVIEEANKRGLFVVGITHPSPAQAEGFRDLSHRGER